MQLLKRLCETPGVSGFEREVQSIVIGELERTCDEVHTDRVGNVIGRKKAVKRASRKKPLKIMFAAHVDEIGFMVRHIDDDGFISFAPIGGFDPRLLLGRRVLVHGRKDVRGVIAPQPGCILTAEDKKKIVEIKDMVIDVAMPAEKVNKLVCVGDVISLDQDFRRLNDSVVTGRNFDDRVGVYCMLEAMKRIADNRAEVYAVSTVQEEVGLRGVPAAAFSVEPDIGIAIDGSLASDVPYASAKDKNCFLGRGTGVYIMDRLTIGHPDLVRTLIDLCEKHEIKYQRNIGGGTDASVIQRSKLGAMCTTIGAPTRYMHSTVQLCHLDDIEQTIMLLKVFAEHAHEMDGGR